MESSCLDRGTGGWRRAARCERQPPPSGDGAAPGGHGTISGWANPDERPANAFPIFGFDWKLLGIYVSGLGIIDRSQFDEPGFDPEGAARDKWGDEEYYRRLQALQATQEPARELDGAPEPP